MKKIFLLFTIILTASLFISCGNKALTDDCGCFINYEDALNYSNKKKQPLLVFFTSDSDDSSAQLVSDVIKDNSFTQTIANKYSVLHIDFSQDAYQKTVVPQNASESQQKLANTYTTILQNNYQLAKLYGISSTPSIFLCTKEGFVVKQLEAEEDFVSFAAFEEALNESQSELERFNSMVSQTKKGNTLQKVEAIDALYLATAPAYRSFLIELAQSVPELDKKNQTGLCSRYILAAAEAEAFAAYSRGDIESAVKKYLQAANNDFVKPEDKQECFYTAAYLVVSSGSDDYTGVVSYLQTAYDLAPASDKAPAIKEAVDYFALLAQSKSELPE